MYEDIRSNKIRSGLIISIFIVVITLIVYYICMAFDLGGLSIVFALIFSIISAGASYYNSDKIVLAMSGARPATHAENQKLVNILDALVISSGIGVTPKLYIVDDKQPNAFATGRDPEHSVMVGFVVILSDIFTRSFIRRGSRDNDNNGNAILMLIGLIFLILAPIFGKLIQLAFSRRREFLADATSAKYTRNPDGLISALEKISGDPNELSRANKSTAHMYIASPFRDKKIEKSSIWSTHPSLDERVNALRNLK